MPPTYGSLVAAGQSPFITSLRLQHSSFTTTTSKVLQEQYDSPAIQHHARPSSSRPCPIRRSKVNQAWDTVESIWQAIQTKAGQFWTLFGEESHILDHGSIPDYVFHHAPYVHLFSGEQFWPCSLDSHLRHTTPHLNYTAISAAINVTVDDLASLNSFGFYTYLQSDDNVESRPTWLGGASNIPSDPGSSSAPNVTTPGGYSSAPAILITVRKAGGIVDAFWFYFYSYNLGNKVGLRFGNHVGDWEHTLVRFQHGRPIEVFLSEHNFGEAYAWSAMEKIGERPVTFSATGSHAMYATSGLHPYALPWGILHDQTDRGPLWDPTQNVYAYTYDPKARDLRTSTKTPDAPTDWFFYRGHWGDRAYPMSDDRQYQFAGQYHYVSGPLGPIYKNLDRQQVCQGRGQCRIKYWLPPAGVVKEWEGGDWELEEDEEDDMDDDSSG